MKRKIIKIDEELCNGCGECTTGCSEGALQIVDGKAKLVREDFCDGFGDCIGTCPTGALTIEEREAKEFDEEAVVQHLMKTQGPDAVQKMKEAQAKHADEHAPKKASGGCPGMMNFALKKEKKSKKEESANSYKIQAIPSELEQWPVQLHLVNPASDFLKDKELVIMSTCSPVTSPDVHWKYIKGRAVVVACPKLDQTDPYVSKLAEIFTRADVPKVIVLRMQVPCCGGLSFMTKEAKSMSGREDLVVEEHTMGLDGKIINIQNI